jgi:glucokinase
LDQSTQGSVVAVDIGGTKVAAGLVDSHGHITGKIRVAMVSTGTAAAGLAVVQAAIGNVLSHAKADGLNIAGIGVCAPGPLDPRAGIVLNPPNLHCWRNFPLADEIQGRFALPVRVDNDANAAALAETIWGAGTGYEYVFYATLGTGIGTGIVLHRKIYYGRTGGAAEGGHMSIDFHGPVCGCGKRGCIEVLCSGPAIARRARDRIVKTHYAGPMTELAGCVEAVRAEDVGEAHKRGDKLAAEILGETATLLAVWLGNIVDLLEPDVIILGRGVSEMMAPWIGAISEQVRQWSVNTRAGEIPIVQAKYRSDAGIAGAAALIFGAV